MSLRISCTYIRYSGHAKAERSRHQLLCTHPRHTREGRRQAASATISRSGNKDTNDRPVTSEVANGVDEIRGDDISNDFQSRSEAANGVGEISEDNDCCRSGYGFVVDARPDVHPETCIPITHVVQASLDDELTMARENCTHDHTLCGAINVNLIGAIMIHAWSRTSEEINLPGPYSCKKKSQAASRETEIVIQSINFLSIVVKG